MLTALTGDITAGTGTSYLWSIEELTTAKTRFLKSCEGDISPRIMPEAYRYDMDAI